jgi:hypothetical protein
MPRDDSLTPRDLADKGLDLLRVECEKCGPLRSLPCDDAHRANRVGWQADGLALQLTKDCPRKRSPGLSDPCGARCPDLPKVV